MVALLVAGSIAGAAYGCSRAESLAPPPILPIGGDFVLTDHNGRHFALSSLRGRVVLIFFGYTFCPDACPTTLSKIAAVAARLGRDGDRLKTLYVSVDPERDTPDVLKADLANFHLDALGLAGTEAEIDRVTDLYGAAYEITSMPESAAKYSIAHTTTLYALWRVAEEMSRRDGPVGTTTIAAELMRLDLATGTYLGILGLVAHAMQRNSRFHRGMFKGGRYCDGWIIRDIYERENEDPPKEQYLWWERKVSPREDLI
jgi:protein SCO1